MTALDVCEPQVIRALEKDGWQILRKPLPIRVPGRTVFADFSIRRIFDGQEEQIVVVEVKCFTNPDHDLQEFYAAIGQYQFYQGALQLIGVNVPVYLALPAEVYERFVNDPTIMIVLKNALINLLVVDIVKEELVQWLSYPKS
ncbi:MAG: hypothetical protein H7X77_05535 [Anaerolineae bacterium]|nr:hypothetical protein [Anaerolineae bacterium]